MKNMVAALAAAILVSLVSACGNHGAFDGWSGVTHYACQNYPTYEEVEAVLEEQADLINQLEEEGLSYGAGITQCSQGTGAYITIFHGGQSQVEPILRIIDEAGGREEGIYKFFGIPFILGNV